MIRDAITADFAAVLALNAESVRFLSPLTIDRIVVHPDWRGRGLGATLYEAMIDFAGRTNVSPLTCEFDLDPPNPASLAFHKRHGFREVGTQWLYGGKKQVSLQARSIEPV